MRLSRFPTDYIVRKLASHVCELDIIVYKLYSSSQTGWEYRELISQVCDRTGQFVNPDYVCELDRNIANWSVQFANR